jgi:hypothetical protein
VGSADVVYDDDDDRKAATMRATKSWTKRFSMAMLAASVGALAVLMAPVGPAVAQTGLTSGGAVATDGSVASGTAEAHDGSVASGDAVAVDYSTASGEAVAVDGSVASGCSTAVDNSTTSGGACPVPSIVQAFSVPVADSPATPAASAPAASAAPAVGTLARTGSSTGPLVAVGVAAVLAGLALVGRPSRRRLTFG